MWANLLNFLAGQLARKYTYALSKLNTQCHEGPHNCIGFRFAIVESVLGVFVLFTAELIVENRMKSLLFALVRAFEFEPAVPTGGIAFSLTPVMRPRVLAEPEGGNQLPLIVRPYVTT